MRICLVANAKSQHIIRLANFLAGKQHEVHIISLHKNPSLEADCYIHILGKNFLSWPWRIKALITRIQPDIIDGHYATVNGFLAALSGFQPLMITLWGSDIFLKPWQNPMWKMTTRFALDHATLINCLFSIYLAEPYIKRLSVKNKQIRNSILGVDTTHFSAQKQYLSAQLADELQIDISKMVIINMRGFGPVYDFHTFLKSIPIVLSMVPEAQFVAIHKPGQKDYGIGLSRKLGVFENILFLEWLPRSKLPLLLSIANIYVSTSLSDGASNSLFEAMACQLAPITTDIPANKEWITHGKNGLLFPKGDSINLAKNIIYLSNNPVLRKEFGLKCRNIARIELEQNDNMKKIESFYYELVQAQNSSGIAPHQ